MIYLTQTWFLQRLLRRCFALLSGSRSCSVRHRGRAEKSWRQPRGRRWIHWRFRSCGRFQNLNGKLFLRNSERLTFCELLSRTGDPVDVAFTKARTRSHTLYGDLRHEQRAQRELWKKVLIFLFDLACSMFWQRAGNWQSWSAQMPHPGAFVVQSQVHSCC